MGVWCDEEEETRVGIERELSGQGDLFLDISRTHPIGDTEPIDRVPMMGRERS